MNAEPGAARDVARAAPARRLARSAGVISLATMTSRVLGLARDLALAHVFGAGHEMDAYTVAFRIPNLLRDLFAEGAMSSAFVPTFTRVLTLEGRQAAWRLGNLVITALLLVTGVAGARWAWSSPWPHRAASPPRTTPPSPASWSSRCRWRA